MPNIPPNPIDPLSIDSVQIMRCIERQYFKLFYDAPPYESLGYSIIYNKMLPENGRMVQRMGCMLDKPPRLEGFFEPGLHAAVAQDENTQLCQSILELFTVEDNVPLQWQFDITTNGVWEQVIYEIPWLIPLSGGLHRFPGTDKWLSANDSDTIREVDFTQLEDEILILKDIKNNAQGTVALASEHVDQVVKVLEFWLKIEAHLKKIKAGNWIISHRHLDTSDKNVIVISNQGQQQALIDRDHGMEQMLPNALIIKGDLFRLGGILISDKIQKERI